MSGKYMFSVIFGSRLNNHIGLASKQYATDNFFFNVMIHVSVFLISLPETVIGLSLGGISESLPDHLFTSNLTIRFLSSLTSFFN